MHICIVGTGAAGWIACNYLKNLDFIEKITIIGSSKIPPIGVGESTTLLINEFIDPLIENNEFTLEDFIKNTDAAIKYGVLYQGWSEKDYIHYFKNYKEFSEFEEIYSRDFYGRLLANKEEKTYIHDLIGKKLYKESLNNNVFSNNPFYLNAYHFDASKFIDFFSKVALKNNKVTFLDAEVLGGKKEKDKVEFIQTKDQEIFADFFIFATGDSKINENFLNIEYEDLSHILKTNKAVFYPLEYTDKEKEFHPYTVAKTMKHGWRWVTPTWSRIGTGYVFSTDYVSVDEAIKEFIEDVGDSSIVPRVVDFYPRHNKKEIHENWCTLGLSSGFVEPLDAPGLSLTISSVTNQISYYLSYLFFSKNISQERKESEIEKINDVLYTNFIFWAIFIFCQYKTSQRNDTKFWKDYKKNKWDVYENFIKILDEENPNIEKFMIRQTLASRNIRWDTCLSALPYKTKDPEDIFLEHHVEFIKKQRNVCADTIYE
jgi:hypothetical protein